ncbi:mitotic fidelity of chromosome transmission-related protein [Marasmius crinis-equi]|uniref:Mitotic fidelity of chromosome transmission-related protein n=1 Tax=Marasmius crinis-equi TaxID=585013 RepID=A0ABR3F9I1_9AGAR
MDREDTETPRPPSPTGSTTSNSTISSYADATGESSSDTTILPPSTSMNDSKSAVAETTASTSNPDSGLHESKFTLVHAPTQSEYEHTVPEVHLTSPGGGKTELDDTADGLGEEVTAGNTAGSSSMGRSSDGLEPPPKKRNRTSSRSKSVSYREDTKFGDSAQASPEQGWDVDTPQIGKVLQYKTGEEVERNLTCTAVFADSALQRSSAEWSFRKDFGDDSFIASGRLLLPPNALKAYKTTKDNTYVFYVVEGAICARIHETKYILCQGASFLVPRGNRYSIQNLTNRQARLHFVQARELHPAEIEDPLRLASPSSSDLPKRARPSIFTSKIVILLSFLLERLMKRFAKYRKVFQKLYLRYAMTVAKSIRAGPKAYMAFFFLGFLIRGISFRKSFVPTIRVMIGGQSSSSPRREIAG